MPIVESSEGEAMCIDKIEDKKQFEYGCFFCRTGSELQVAQEIEQILPMATAIVPSKLRTRKVNGKLTEEKIPLFPGYVFARMISERHMYDLLQKRQIFNILTDSEGDWKLKGSDRAFAEELYKCGGVLGFSKAYYDVDDRIHVTEGPLANYNGQILRVNRHHKTAEVLISFQRISMRVWLGFELIELNPC